MQAVKDEIETIHLYVVREEEKPPFPTLPVVVLVLYASTIVGVLLFLAFHPLLTHETLTIPAQFLPDQTFTTEQPILPTGVKTYPAITAHGILTITNGSVISQVIPKGFIVDTVATDSAVFVPAGSADGYGYATVQAHALVSGKGGNFAPLTINQVVGASIYIRNLSPFTGGNDSYSVQIITEQDRQTARDAARASLITQVARIHAILAKPCIESSQEQQAVTLTWTCQYVSYPSLPGMNIISIHLVGKKLLVNVEFVARPKMIIRK